MARAKKQKEEVIDASGDELEQTDEAAVEEEQEQEAAPALLIGHTVHARLQQGFRRCGRFFGQEQTTFAPGELTEAELAILKAERMLVVKEVTFKNEV